MNLEGQTFDREYDISGEIFDSHVTFKDIVFKTGIKAVGTVFNNGVTFSGCNLRSVNFTKSKVIGPFELFSCKVEQWSVFTDSVFEDGLSIDNCRFTERVIFDRVNVKDENHYWYHSEISNTVFESYVDFTDSVFDARFIFSDIEIWGDFNFINVTTVSENYDKEYRSSIQFVNISVLENATVKFIGKEGKKLFSEEIVLTVGKLYGLVIFEYANYYNVPEVYRRKLNEFILNNKVIVGKGCIKYRLQTDLITHITGSLNQKLIEDMANTFINFFTKHNRINLGFEITERSVDKISYFYFSDENISHEEFIKYLKYTEEDVWSLIKNERPKRKIDEDLAVITSDDNRYFNYTKASLVSIFYQFQLGLDYEETLPNDLEKVMGAIHFSENWDSLFPNLIYLLNRNFNQKKLQNNFQFIMMGDHFENISGTIINRSLVTGSFNKVKESLDDEAAKLLQEITQAVEKSGDKDATELMTSFHEELQKPTPKKTLLKSLWSSITTFIPALISNTEKVVDIIEKVGNMATS